MFFSITNAFSQERNAYVAKDSRNVPINIYEDELSERIKHVIMEDTLFDIWYFFTIYDNSPLRFKVGVSTIYDKPFLIGWIDKKHCGVHLVVNESYKTLKLYEKPELDSNYEKIVLERGDWDAIVVDIHPDGFMKIVFRYNDVIYTGWTKEYCSNPIASCE